MCECECARAGQGVGKDVLIRAIRPRDPSKASVKMCRALQPSLGPARMHVCPGSSKRVHVNLDHIEVRVCMESNCLQHRPKNRKEHKKCR